MSVRAGDEVRMKIEEKRSFHRVICCLASKHEISQPLLGENLVKKYAIMKSRFGEKADIMLSVRREDDPFSEVGGDRKIESLEAFMQISFPVSDSLDDIVIRLEGLSGDLEDVIDIERSSISIGQAVVILDSPGEVFLGFLGRRRPDMSIQEMRDYWLNIHAPLAIELMGPPLSHHGYDQLHVDQEKSRKAAEIAGFPYVEYDMGDSINVPDLAEFLHAMSDETVARQLYEDETRFLDTTSWRGAFTDKL
jgi:EthD domain